MEELILVERTDGGTTKVVQPEPLSADDELRALGEFDDRDAPPDQEPILAERLLNERIRSMVGQELTIELVPDFEGVAGSRGHAHKPARAWKHFKSLSPVDVPQPRALTVAADR